MTFVVSTPTFPTPSSARIHPTTTPTTPTFPTPSSARIHPTTTPTFPTPASARIHPTTTAITPAVRSATAPTAIKPFNSTAVNARPHARAHSSRPTHISTEAFVFAAIAVLLLLACAAWAFARSRAYEPHWLVSLRHAMAEAGFRTSATWAEFSDWMRLGH